MQDSLPLASVASLLDLNSTASLSDRIQWTDTVLGTNERILDDLRKAQEKLAAARAAKDEAQKKADEAKKASDEQLQATVDAQAAADQATVDAQAAADDVQAALDEQVEAKNAAAQALADDQKTLSETKAEQARVNALIAEQARKAAEAAKAGTVYVNPASGFMWPVRGSITAGYGYRVHPIYHYVAFHDGTDIGVACGTSIKAAAAGKVTQTYYNWSYGNRVFIDHGYMNGKYLITSYSHLMRYVVGPGQSVKQGQVIGYAGQTGQATGCHLHFSVYVNGATVNPMAYL
jgi:murein DD-endopeptidase MepM/ murein hydrolase activator NlpD